MKMINIRYVSKKQWTDFSKWYCILIVWSLGLYKIVFNPKGLTNFNGYPYNPRVLIFFQELIPPMPGLEHIIQKNCIHNLMSDISPEKQAMK